MWYSESKVIFNRKNYLYIVTVCLFGKLLNYSKTMSLEAMSPYCL